MTPSGKSLSSRLSEEFKKGDYRPGNLLPSERILTQKFKVSRPTLRKALLELRADGLLQNLPGKGYRLLARRSKPKPSGPQVSFLIPNLQNPFYASLASELSSRFRAGTCAVAIYDYRDDLSSLPEAVRQLRERDGGAVAIHFPGSREAILSLPKSCEGPLVLIHPFPDLAPELPYDQVLIDSFGGGKKVVRHLLSLGRRNIFYLALPGQAPERLRGGKTAAFEEGAPLDELPMQLSGFVGAREAVLRAIENKISIDALFCANDDIALGALAALQEKGISVPNEIAVTGFDDIDASRMARPALTTIRLSASELADTAAEILKLQLEKQNSVLRKIPIASELVVRASTLRS